MMSEAFHPTNHPQSVLPSRWTRTDHGDRHTDVLCPIKDCDKTTQNIYPELVLRPFRGEFRMGHCSILFIVNKNDKMLWTTEAILPQRRCMMSGEMSSLHPSHPLPQRSSGHHIQIFICASGREHRLGGKLEHLEETETGGEHANPTQEGPPHPGTEPSSSPKFSICKRWQTNK